MDIKWKNKISVFIWALLVTFSLTGILSFFAYGTDYLHRDYFNTPSLMSEVDRLAMLVTIFELNDITLEEAKENITVSDEEIEEHRYRYGGLPEQLKSINSQYYHQIQEAKENNNEALRDSLIKERDTKLEDITKNFESDDHVRKKVIAEKENKIDMYFEAREKERLYYLTYKNTFHYYFIDSTTGDVYTNLDLSGDKKPEELMDKENMHYVTTYSITKDEVMNYSLSYEYGLVADAILPETIGGFDGKIGLPKSLTSSNWIMSDYYDYKQKQRILLGFALISLVVFILCFIYWRRSALIPAEIEQYRPYYTRIPIDIRVIILLISGFASIISMLYLTERIFYVSEYGLSYSWDVFSSLLLATVMIVLTLAQGTLLAQELKHWNTVKSEWQSGIINQTWRKVKQLLMEAFLNRTIGIQVFLLLAVVFGLGFFAIINLIDPTFIIVYILIILFVGIPVVVLLLRQIGYLNRIIKASNDLVEGNFNNELNVPGKSVLAKLAKNVNVLKQGVSASQSAQAKSERLKTELISNVSHDLRTPLTSIITYTELLKAQDVTEDERAAYVEIIDRKSKRLQLLIDDLFEVSKMASGSIELTKEKVDLVQLLQQTLGEYDDQIKESSLQFRVSNLENPVFSLVDGQKIWRVFDNLIGNILKYSLDHSRVYIQVTTSNGQAIITFKNISKYELSDNSDELFERFKRGDTSRHTDGSGLGLAIAKSIVDLHEGSLAIDTDGDLFKVSIFLKQVDV